MDIEQITNDVEGVVNRTVTMSSRDDVNLDILFNKPYEKEEGTPNKAIAYAIEQCIEIHNELMDFSSILFVPRNIKRILTTSTDSNILINDIESFITNDLRKAKRGALNDDEKRLINNIFEISLKGIKSHSQTIEVHISRIWYSLMIKSISDVAQFASLIRNSHILIENK